MTSLDKLCIDAIRILSAEAVQRADGLAGPDDGLVQTRAAELCAVPLVARRQQVIKPYG